MLPRKLPRSNGAVRHSAIDRAKAPLCRAFSCAEEDSNLHPVSLDQALNLARESVDLSRSCTSVQIIWSRGRYGRSDDLDVATDVATSRHGNTNGSHVALTRLGR